MEKYCKKCEQTKSTTEFYKCTPNKDGLQHYCKICCNKSSKEFRVKRPDYYWGEDGYFRNNYEELMVYQKGRQTADKSPKVYMITTPDGVYIGSTKRFLYLRMIGHLTDYITGKKIIPLLHQSFDRYTIPEVRQFIKDVKLLEEFEGDRSEARKRELYWIEHYSNLGYNLLNMRKPYREKKSKKNLAK